MDEAAKMSELPLCPYFKALLQRKFFHSYLHMLWVHLQIQTTDLGGVICLGKENNRRKSSPVIQITQKAAYTWVGEEKEWKS